MSYVKSVLQPGEEVILRGRLHWIAYWHAILFLVLGVAIVWGEHKYLTAGQRTDVIIGTTAIIFGTLFLIAFLRAWWIRWITEIAVTNRRIIYKRGFINRHTEEMNMDKVASVDVDQSILGRMLDYGTVHIVGTGGASNLDRADVREAVREVISERNGSGRRQHTDDSRFGSIEHLHQIAQPLALRNAITAK